MFRRMRLAVLLYIIRVRLNGALSKTIRETRASNIPVEKLQEIFVTVFNKVIRKEVEQMVPPNMD